MGAFVTGSASDMFPFGSGFPNQEGPDAPPALKLGAIVGGVLSLALSGRFLNKRVADSRSIPRGHRTFSYGFVAS